MTQATSEYLNRPSRSPNEVLSARMKNVPGTIYILFDEDGDIRERSASEMLKAQTVEDIANGDVAVSKVLEICEADDLCRNVSEDVARLALKQMSGNWDDFAEDANLIPEFIRENCPDHLDVILQEIAEDANCEARHRRDCQRDFEATRGLASPTHIAAE